MDSQNVSSRFFATARAHIERPAVVFRRPGKWVCWSYAELAERVRDIKRFLNWLDRKPGEAIGIVASREPDTIASMIAILDIGAHYIPLDPAYPAVRLQHLCNDAGITHVLSAKQIPDLQQMGANVHALDEVDSHDSSKDPGMDDDREIFQDTPAYVMFTSGSTGEPKGVVVPHRAIIRLIDEPNFMRLAPDCIFLHLAPLSFDASTLEIWGPLLNGGSVVLYPDGQLPTCSAIGKVVVETSVNCLWLTASLFNSIVDQDPSNLVGVRQLLSGGEALSVPHVCRAMAVLTDTQLINGYGPTENTTFTSCYRIPAGFSASERSVPIGVPISGTSVEIVDEQLASLDAEIEGELVALGDGLALGYLNNPEMTGERFVTIVRKDGTEARGYRTGDQAMWRKDGLLEYWGRLDDQVKIEGHRIEPGEIERTIVGLSGIRECRVLVRSESSGKKRLVAYLVADPDLPERNLRARLAPLLPTFMIPHYVLYLERLPVNANGKLDKSALPDPLSQPIGRDEAGGTPERAMVGQAWEDILGHRPSSIDLNFFDAGGTSLDAVKLYELLSERLPAPLDSTFVFEYTTINKQADALTSMSGQSGQSAAGRGRKRRLAAGRVARSQR